MSTTSENPAPTEPSPLALAAMAAVAVPGLDPVRLAEPQLESATLRVVGVMDTKGRHWDVWHARTAAQGAELEAESEVLRRIARRRDDGRLSFDVPRPAGSLNQDETYIQVRSHIDGRPLQPTELHPGPGLSAGLGKVLAEIHELPQSVISESGLPVYEAEDVRQRWNTLLGEALETGYLPSALAVRWQQVIDAEALWHFRPSVVHGDLSEENIVVAGGAVVAMRGWSQAQVGDPAVDLAWLYANAPVESLDSIEDAYDRARSEGVDKHLRDRADLISEMQVAQWLMHGVRSNNQGIIDDAVRMLEDLYAQVGDEPLIEGLAPRLAPAPGERESAGPDEATAAIDMRPIQDEESGTQGS